MGNCSTYCCSSEDFEDALHNRSRSPSPQKRDSQLGPQVNRPIQLFEMSVDEITNVEVMQAGQEMPRVPNRDIGSRSRFDNYFKTECTEVFSLEQHLDYIF